MSRASGPSTMYSGTACDVCGGPTLAMRFGSIWCAAEDPHPGGHFVKRVAFERAPTKRTPGNFSIEYNDDGTLIKPRAIKPPAPATVIKPKAPAFGAGGYDDFVKGEDK